MTFTIPYAVFWFTAGWLASWGALFVLALVMHRRKAVAA